MAQFNHPELHAGEIFICNVTTEQSFDAIGWQSKRRGETSYLIAGKDQTIVLTSPWFPVFAATEEIEIYNPRILARMQGKLFAHYFENDPLHAEYQGLIEVHSSITTRSL